VLPTLHQAGVELKMLAIQRPLSLHFAPNQIDVSKVKTITPNNEAHTKEKKIV
jgi:hypothetical protein